MGSGTTTGVLVVNLHECDSDGKEPPDVDDPQVEAQGPLPTGEAEVQDRYKLTASS